MIFAVLEPVVTMQIRFGHAAGTLAHRTLTVEEGRSAPNPDAGRESRKFGECSLALRESDPNHRATAFLARRSLGNNKAQLSPRSPLRDPPSRRRSRQAKLGALPFLTNALPLRHPAALAD